MGTRGLVGVRIDGQDKLSYNHFDSYPGGLGDDTAKALREFIADKGMGKLKALARGLRLVDERSVPTAKEVAKFSKFANTQVGEQTVDSWYCLLRELQGDLIGTLKAGTMIDGREFIKDSLYCEWAYIANLDDGVLEVYEGFQEKPHRKGRYREKMEQKAVGDIKVDYNYWPCALVATFPLDDLPELISTAKKLKGKG